MGPMERNEISAALGLISGNLEGLRANNIDQNKEKILETIKVIFRKYPEFFRYNRVGLELAGVVEGLQGLQIVQVLQRNELPHFVEAIRAARFGIGNAALRVQGNAVDAEAQMRLIEDHKKITKLLASNPQSIALILTQFNKIRENVYGKELKEALEFALIAENYQLVPLAALDCLTGKDKVDASNLPEIFRNPEVVGKLNQLIPLLKQLSADRVGKFREHFIHGLKDRPRLDPNSIEGKCYALIQGIEASVEMSAFSLEDFRVIARQAIALFSKGGHFKYFYLSYGSWENRCPKNRTSGTGRSFAARSSGSFQSGSNPI